MKAQIIQVYRESEHPGVQRVRARCTVSQSTCESELFCLLAAVGVSLSPAHGPWRRPRGLQRGSHRQQAGPQQGVSGKGQAPRAQEEVPRPAWRGRGHPKGTRGFGETEWDPAVKGPPLGGRVSEREKLKGLSHPAPRPALPSRLRPFSYELQ